MRITIDTSKLSREALQAIDRAPDMERFIIDLIENQLSNPQATIGTEDESVVAILRRIETKIDAIDVSSKRRSFNTDTVETKKNHVDRVHSVQNDKVDNEKAAEELAKALDFFS